MGERIYPYAWVEQHDSIHLEARSLLPLDEVRRYLGKQNGQVFLVQVSVDSDSAANATTEFFPIANAILSRLQVSPER